MSLLLPVFIGRSINAAFNKHMIARKNIITDWQYGLAIIAALLLWGLLLWIDSPQPSLDWVFIAPWLFLSLLLAQPLLEEVVFRGGLQGWLIEKTWGRRTVLHITLANMLTSVAFVAMHLFYHAPLMALLVIVPSLLFGYFRDRYDGWLIPSIVLHCFYNAGYFFLYAPVLPSA